MSRGDFNTAMTNRSLRTIKAELEFLTDASLITPQTLASILEQLPSQTALHAPLSTAPTAPTSPMANLKVKSPSNTFNEKQQNSYFTPSPAPQNPIPNQPPPAYPTAPQPPSVLCYATSLYAFAPTDAGDLGFAAGERIAVTEYMNSEWWKGRSHITGQEGIFPRAYVRAEDTPMKTPSTDYGNMPLEVSQGGGQGGDMPSKTHEQGKKFGKKLGNAAIFGAGASIGSNIVNGIL